MPIFHLRHFPLFLPLLMLGAGLSSAAAQTAPPDDPPYPVTTKVLAVPAAAGALAPALATVGDGTTWLSWIEHRNSDGRLCIAHYDAGSQAWPGTREITTEAHLSINAADTPLLAADANGRLAVIRAVTTPEGKSKTQISRSFDRGTTWSSPVLLTSESDHVEFPSLAWLPDGRLLAVWLDGRATSNGGATQLYARIVGSDEPDTLVDDRVCDCCATALTVFPNGTALLAYRGRSKNEIRDIQVATWNGSQWTPGHVLSEDDWRIDGCPVNGPRISSAGGQVAVAWFTAGGNVPRVQVSTSPDAGRRFILPQSIDLGHAIGRADTIMLRDGSVLTIWLENGDKPGLWLRYLAPDGEPFAAVRLANTANGYPRLALVKDYDRTPAQILVTYTQGTPAGVHALLVTLPNLSVLTKRNPCIPCDEHDANATRGYPIKGRVTQVLSEQGLVMVRHGEIPGVMRAMTMAFKVDPQVLPRLKVGQDLLGRIERRDRDWWLFHLRFLGKPSRVKQTP